MYKCTCLCIYIYTYVYTYIHTQYMHVYSTPLESLLLAISPVAYPTQEVVSSGGYCPGLGG